MLETVREFAQARLAERDGEPPVRRAMLADELRAVALAADGLLERAQLRAVPVGVMRRVNVLFET